MFTSQISDIIGEFKTIPDSLYLLFDKILQLLIFTTLLILLSYLLLSTALQKYQTLYKNDNERNHFIELNGCLYHIKYFFPVLSLMQGVIVKEHKSNVKYFFVFFFMAPLTIFSIRFLFPLNEITLGLSFIVTFTLVYVAGLYLVQFIIFKLFNNNFKFKRARSKKLIIVISSTLVSVFCYIYLYPGDLALLGRLQSLNVLLLSLCLITCIFHYIDVLERKNNIPILPLLVLFGILLSLFGLNDNKGINLKTFENSDLYSLNDYDAFNVLNKWLEKKAKPNNGNRIPVIFVSIEGGGIYSAAYSSLLLEKLSRIEGFKEHLFVISGVSGGSVGATLYVSALKNKLLLENPVDTTNQHPIKEFLEIDHLSPIIGATFFLEPVNFINPFARFGLHLKDRSKYLEDSLALREPLGTFFNDDILTYNEKFEFPFLVINSTNAKNGSRVVFSPINIGGENLNKLEEQNNDTVNDEKKKKGVPPFYHFKSFIGEDKSVTIGAAAVASARFPIVSPPATLGDGRENAYLVDGGYYENSGASTLNDIMNEILFQNNPRKFGQSIQTRKIRDNVVDKYKFLFIRIGNDFEYETNKGNFYFGEFTAPLSALYSSRIERQYSDLLQSRFILEAHCKESIYVRFRINPSHLKLPLGWDVSKKSVNNILEFVELKKDNFKNDNHFDKIEINIDSNRISECRIRDFLRK